MIKGILSFLLVCLISCKDHKTQNQPKIPCTVSVSCLVTKEDATRISSFLLQKGKKRVYVRKNRNINDYYEVIVGNDLSKKEPCYQFVSAHYYDICFHMKYINELELLTFEFLI